MKINLLQPIKYKDTEIHTLELDLEALTGRDLIAAEEALKARGQNISAWEFSRTFLAAIAGRAAHIPPEVLEGMSASDFTHTVNEVLSFLAGQDSGASAQES